MTEFIKIYLERSQRALEGLPLDVIEEVVALLFQAWRDGRQVFLMGNGGSSAVSTSKKKLPSCVELISNRRSPKKIEPAMRPR